MALLTIGEAAAHLQVSTSALRDWSNDGRVPCEQRPRRYDLRVLDGSDVQALAARYRATYGERTVEDGRLTLPQVTERLGVPEHYVRAFLVDAGKLGVKAGGGFVVPAEGNEALVEYRNTAYAELARLLARLGPAPVGRARGPGDRRGAGRNTPHHARGRVRHATGAGRGPGP